MKAKPRNIIILIVFAIVLILVAAFIVTARIGENSTAESDIISYNGKKYTLNTDIRNYLFMGIDAREDFEEDEVAPGEANQADCLILLSVNTKTKDASVMQINRNAMTELDIYDESGAICRTQYGQICLQYAYCTGGEKSCEAEVKTVSQMLFGIQIDGYFSMNLMGIQEINDALGGVDVVMKKDYTFLNPTFIEGETVHLEGYQAELFLHYRNIEEFNSVQDRMERQVSYITAMVNSLKNKGGFSIAQALLPFVGNYILTDMDLFEINDFRSFNYNLDEIYYLPGEMVQGEVYEEFDISNSQLQELLLQLLYKEVK